MATAPKDGRDLWLLRVGGATTRGAWCRRTGAWLTDDSIDKPNFYLHRGCPDSAFAGWMAWPPVGEGQAQAEAEAIV
jgi:hypothetical protein